MKNVQGLLEQQKQARKEFKAQQALEREALAINVLADTKEILRTLKCEYLLEAEVKEVVVEKEIEVIKEVEKIVEVEKLVEVKVPDTKSSEMLKQAIKSKDAYIVELEEQLQNKAFNAAENGYVVDGIEVSVAIVKELNDKIVKLQEQLAYNETPEVKEIAIDEEAAYLEYLASQEECPSVVEEEPVVIEKEKEEVLAPVTTEVYVKQLKANISKYNGSARIYQTDKCYLIASPTTDEITWLSNVELTEEYKLVVENKLVDEFKFLPARTKLSPITINRENGYMARVSAKEGYQNFSMRDVLSGYVKINNKFYLYSYSPASTNVFVEDFDKKRRGEAKTFPAGMKERIVPVVMDMYKEYKELLDAKVKQDEIKAEEAALKFNERVASRDKQREADKEIVARTLKTANKNKGVKAPKAVVMSDTLAELESEIF